MIVLASLAPAPTLTSNSGNTDTRSEGIAIGIDDCVSYHDWRASLDRSKSGFSSDIVSLGPDGELRRVCAHWSVLERAPLQTAVVSGIWTADATGGRVFSVGLPRVSEDLPPNSRVAYLEQFEVVNRQKQAGDFGMVERIWRLVVPAYEEGKGAISHRVSDDVVGENVKRINAAAAKGGLNGLARQQDVQGMEILPIAEIQHIRAKASLKITCQ